MYIDNADEVVVRWNDEGHWAHVGLDHGDGRKPAFVGFAPLTDGLQRMLLGRGVLQDDTGMWEARLPARATRGDTA
ncbi:hypothetical protein MOQ72_26905 [Saccharopolyspora sp. K220]|uniref:hypothetical protein n=1 Tax=Saccharopolyspora soli TaxID=2926618 RepID=UPI001F55BA26|nr:hypothetical protein [Saccharopolyspora soli]MCI2421078.1 hypothetical protein [Saccharopolyspora soli]